MKVYRFTISIGDYDDSVCFKFQPTRADVQAAFEAQAKLAGEEWQFLYDEIQEALARSVQLKTWPTLREDMAACGGPLMRKNQVFGTWNYEAWRVIDNGTR